MDNFGPTDITLKRFSDKFTEHVDNVIFGVLEVADKDMADVHKLELVSGEGSDDNSKFTLNEQTLMLKEKIDCSKQNSYKIRIKVTDKNGEGREFEKSLTIKVANKNVMPSNVYLEKNPKFVGGNIPEFQKKTIVGTIKIVDCNKDDKHTISLVKKYNGDHDKFEIDGDKLV